MTRPSYRLRVWLPHESHAADTFSACLGEKPLLAFRTLLKLKSPPCIESTASAEPSVMVYAVAEIPVHSCSESNQHDRRLLAIVYQKCRVDAFAVILDRVNTPRIATVVSRTRQPHLNKLPENLRVSDWQLQLE